MAKTETEEKTTEATENEYLVTFNKPFKFEGKEYLSIDLSGLKRLTIRDAIDAQKVLFRQQEVAASLLCETTTAFSMELARAATERPVEFFKLLPRGAGKQIKTMVQSFINIKNSGSEGVLTLEEPYYYGGEEFREFDLSGIADLNMMAETAAENAMAREGFIVTENSFNYLYACIIAGMATKQPTELFTGLPLRELLKLKETVNNSGFFE